MKSRTFMILFISSIITLIAFPATSRAVTFPINYEGDVHITAALSSPSNVSAECSLIQWSQSDFPASVAASIFISNTYTYFGYWIYPYGPKMRFISVAVRSDKTPEGNESYYALQKSMKGPPWTSLGRVPELEDTAAEEVYAYRYVQSAPDNPGEVNFALLGQYNGNTTIYVVSPNNWDAPLIIPETLHYDAYREAKNLISKKCPQITLVPLEAEIQAGGSIVFAVKDANNQPVDPSMITWSVIQQQSINPFVSTRNALIGTINSVGLFSGTGIGTCVVRAVTGNGQVLDANVTVRCPSGSGDINKVKELFGQRIPEGPILKALQEGNVIPILSSMNPGYATNLSSITDARYSDFTCGGYQGQVLEFLHRLQSDPQECSLLNGLEFGPIQGSMGGHHAVVIYAQGEDWKKQGVVLDPWYHQRPESFSIDVWSQVFSPIAGDMSPSYRLKYPTTKDPSDVHTDFWGTTAALVQDMSQVAGVVVGEINLILKDLQNHQNGVDANGTWHYEIPDAFFMRMPDGSGRYEWYFRLSGEIPSYLRMQDGSGGYEWYFMSGDIPGYQIEIRGTDTGTFRMTTVSPSTTSAYVYDTQQISADTAASALISGGSPAPPLTLPGGTQASPNIFALPEGCWLVNEDLDILIPRAEYGGGYYTFKLKYSHDLFWELDLGSFGTTGSGINIPVGSDFSLPFYCAEYDGQQYRFIMRYVYDLYWMLDPQTFGVR